MNVCSVASSWRLLSQESAWLAPEIFWSLYALILYPAVNAGASVAVPVKASVTRLYPPFFGELPAGVDRPEGRSVTHELTGLSSTHELTGRSSTYRLAVHRDSPTLNLARAA